MTRRREAPASIVPTGSTPSNGASTTATAAPRFVVHGLARRISSGAITVEEGERHRRFGDGGPAVTVRVHDPRTYRALLRTGGRGLARSYVEGWWDCDDLTSLAQVLIRSSLGVWSLRDRIGRAASCLADPLSRLRTGPTREESRRDIVAHYDLGNDFYALMLDPTMSYSCAIFERPEDTLEAASVAKLDRVCTKLGLSPADHVVEIGTGWGGFAVHAAGTYGCRVTTTTISAEQYRAARQRVTDAGLSDLVTVLQADYRDLEGRYDKLVSIEMIEAVDWRQLDTFFRSCSNLLRPDGLMALQAIVIADRSYEWAKRHRDFIKEDIFPGSCLPSVGAITRSTTRATDLGIIDLEDIGRHYAETLRRWRTNVDARLDDVERLGLGPTFVRLWRLYLSYCEAAFLERHVSDVQMVLAKPAWRSPLGVR